MLSKFFGRKFCQKNVLKTSNIYLANKNLFKFNFRQFSELKLDQEESDPDFQSKVKGQKQQENQNQDNNEELLDDAVVHEVQFDADLENQELIQQIQQAIKDNKILLFMKGNPEAPQCGYSRLMIELLNFYGVEEYSFVNVLEFPELRAAIKEATQWQTFPQLYRKGEFIGGSDIAFQLHQDDKLKESLIDGEHAK